MNDNVLLEKINNLTKKVEDGFAGVWKRQDLTNGNILANKNKIVLLEKEDIKIKDKLKTNKVFWLTLTTCISLLALLLGKYVI